MWGCLDLVSRQPLFVFAEGQLILPPSVSRAILPGHRRYFAALPDRDRSVTLRKRLGSALISAFPGWMVSEQEVAPIAIDSMPFNWFIEILCVWAFWGAIQPVNDGMEYQICYAA